MLPVFLLLMGMLLIYSGFHKMSVTDVFRQLLGRPVKGLNDPWGLQSDGSGGGSTGATLGQKLKGALGFAGGFLPKGATYKQGRQDQGRDGQTDPGGPIIAPGNGQVLRVASDPGGFGPNYPIVRFSDGPYAGQDIYIGHTHSALTAGAKFSSGEVLSHTGNSPVGNASVPGWFEIGYAPGGVPGPFGQTTPF